MDKENKLQSVTEEVMVEEEVELSLKNTKSIEKKLKANENTRKRTSFSKIKHKKNNRHSLSLPPLDSLDLSLSSDSKTSPLNSPVSNSSSSNNDNNSQCHSLASLPNITDSTPSSPQTSPKQSNYNNDNIKYKYKSLLLSSQSSSSSSFKSSSSASNESVFTIYLDGYINELKMKHINITFCFICEKETKQLKNSVELTGYKIIEYGKWTKIYRDIYYCQDCEKIVEEKNSAVDISTIKLSTKAINTYYYI